MLNISAALLLTLLAAPPIDAAGAETPRHAAVPELHTGAAFDRELERSLFGTWEGVSSRDIFAQISQERKVAILLDRRIDPSRELAITPKGTLLAAIRQIARELSADVSVLDEVIYVGPPHAAARLRTLESLRRQELFAMSNRLAPGRYFTLSRPQTLHWDDLTEPAELLADVERKFQLKIEGLDQIPHDLWAGGTLLAVTAEEALSLLLVQWDLTFEWSENADSVSLVPLPEDVWLERRHTPGRMTPAAAIAKIRERFPELTVELVGRQLLVRGTLEQHEAVANLLAGREPAQTAVAPVPLNRRRFTLNNRNFPVKALMEKLEESGIAFRYDPAELQAAGIELDAMITVIADDATAEEFFELVFGPLGIACEIDGTTVTLVPK